MAIRATVTNNSVGVQTVLTDKTDKLSAVQLPPKSRGVVYFADKSSLEEAAKEAANKDPKVVFITVEE